jgi:hypothetical protein
MHALAHTARGSANGHDDNHRHWASAGFSERWSDRTQLPTSQHGGWRAKSHAVLGHRDHRERERRALGALKVKFTWG